MDDATARERIESMTAWDKVPTLTEDQVDALVVLARRPDSDGLLPSDSGWTGTYALNAAAAEGWRWKAAQVAGDFTFASDGQTFNRADMVKACMAMAQTYSRRVNGSIPLTPTDRFGDLDQIGNINA